MIAGTYPFVYFQGNIVPVEQAKISIASNSLQYGTTVFAGIRGYFRGGKVKIFRLKDHHERLMNATKIMGMDFSISFEEFEKILREMISKNKPEGDFYIRPFIFAQDIQLGPRPTGLHFELAIYFVPMGSYFDPKKGLKLMISSWRKFSDASMPTKAKAGGCYVNSFMATSEALRCGYDDALLMDNEGYIVEASVANLLLVQHGRLVMTEVGSAQLEGITMRTVIELLKEEGKAVSFEKIDRSMAYTAEELLMLGTAAEMTFVQSVDGRKIGNGSQGPICTLLRTKFQSILNGEHPKSKDWITECSV